MKWKKREEQIIKQDPEWPCPEAGHESRVYDVKKIQIFQGTFQDISRSRNQYYQRVVLD